MGLLVVAIFKILRKKTIKNDSFLIMTLLLSTVFLLTNVLKLHFLPFITFAFLVYGRSFKSMKGTGRFLFLCFLFFYTGLILRKTIHLYRTLRSLPQREEFIDTQKIYPLLSHFQIENRRFYILNNHTIEYLHYDVLPPTYLPLYFPLIDSYYPQYEETIVSDLIKNDIRIAIRKKEEMGYPRLPTIENFLGKKFINVEDYPTFILYY